MISQFCLDGHFLERAIQRTEQELKMETKFTDQRFCPCHAVPGKWRSLERPPPTYRREEIVLSYWSLEMLPKCCAGFIWGCLHDTLRPFFNSNYSSTRNTHGGCAQPSWPVGVHRVKGLTNRRLANTDWPQWEKYKASLFTMWCADIQNASTAHKRKVV